MKPALWTPAAALLGVLAAALAATAAEAPPAARISDFLDAGALLRDAGPGPLDLRGPLVPLLQGGGSWGEDSGKKKDKGGKTDPSDWGSDVPKEEPREEALPEEEEEEPAEETLKPARPKDQGPPVAWARKTRIGLEAGGLLPLSAKEVKFDTGQAAGLFLGFDLPELLGGLALTSELRLVEAYTTSSGQEDGFDVTSILVGARVDLLLHLLPMTKAFNAFFFLGVGAVFESSSAEGVDEVSGDPISDSSSDQGFLMDAGLGAWLNLFDPLDLFLRVEIDLIPVSGNMSAFAAVELGVQVKF
jgi:hypothetical protein